jgi:hypothetical protein
MPFGWTGPQPVRCATAQGSAMRTCPAILARGKGVRTRTRQRAHDHYECGKTKMHRSLDRSSR